MGFYDLRCALSGLSTRAAHVHLILLREGATSHELAPIALPIRGTYDRLGSIDNIRPTWNSELLHLALDELLDEPDGDQGHIEVHWSVFSYRPQPLDTLEQILSPIERGNTLGCVTVTWDGDPLRFMVVIDRIYDAAVATIASNRTARFAAAQEQVLRSLPLEELLFKAFRGVEPGPRLYQLLGAASAAEFEKARADLIRFVQFRAFVEAKGHYTYGKNPGQHYDDEERAFVAEARERFDAYPHLLSAIKECASEFFSLTR